MKNTKQVIVWRNDLKVRKGKIAAQCAHAAMAFLTRNVEWRDSLLWVQEDHTQKDEIRHWLNNSFRKICVYVNSEEELVALHEKALQAGLVSHLITDNGTTEFNGVPTRTALAIGPHWDEKFEGITDKLPLL
jgi:PTH2 family peptidyl-tRNA hydrolase